MKTIKLDFIQLASQKFSVGDRVKYIQSVNMLTTIHKGLTGTVIGILDLERYNGGDDMQRLSVEWDIDVGGHDGQFSTATIKGKKGHCWFVDSHDVIKV